MPEINEPSQQMPNMNYNQFNQQISGGASFVEKALNADKVIKEFISYLSEGIEGIDWQWQYGADCFFEDTETGKKILLFPENAKKVPLSTNWKPLVTNPTILNFIRTFLKAHLSEQAGASNPIDPYTEVAMIMYAFNSDLMLERIKLKTKLNGEIPIDLPVYAYISATVSNMILNVKTSAFGEKPLSNKEVASRTETINKTQDLSPFYPMPMQQQQGKGGATFMGQRMG